MWEWSVVFSFIGGLRFLLIDGSGCWSVIGLFFNYVEKSKKEVSAKSKNGLRLLDKK